MAGVLGQHEPVAMVMECFGDPIAGQRPVGVSAGTSAAAAQGLQVVRSLVAGLFG